MRLNLLFIGLLLSTICHGQMLLNPYKDWVNANPTEFIIEKIPTFNPFQDFFGTPNTQFTGEYEIRLPYDFGNVWNRYRTYDPQHPNDPFLWNTYLRCSYKIEVVSFPFSVDCFWNGGVGAECLDNSTTRNLFMPIVSFNAQSSSWGDLSLFTPSPGIIDITPNPNGFNETSQTLISHEFTGHYAPSGGLRTILPHTILKHTLYIHCGNDVANDPKIDSISWYYDNTRGRMKYYPFKDSNIGTNNREHDVQFYPQFIHVYNPNLPTPIYHTYDYNLSNSILKYSTINYFPFNEIANTNCPFNVAQKPQNPSSEYFLSNQHPVFPAPYMLFTAPLRNHDGRYLAGYYRDPTNTNYQLAYILDPSGGSNGYEIGIQHSYHIDKGFPELDLNWINPSEKLIFNPSYADIGPRTGNTNLVNLVFPTGYTFKTMLGAYPSAKQVELANTLANGGPYNDLREVPVPVVAKYIIDPNDPNPNFDDYPDVATNPNEMYSAYEIKNHGKLTVEPCVKIFDTQIQVKTGGTLQIDDFPSIIFPPERNFINPAGGAILRNLKATQDLDFTHVIQDYELKYIATNEINAGNYNLPAPSDFTIEPNNTDVKFLAGSTIRLEPGFSAKEGCSFSARCEPMEYAVKLCASPASSRVSTSISQDFQQKNENIPLSSLMQIHIAPNPSKGIFVIRLNELDSEARLEVKDIYGRLILHRTIDQNNVLIDLTNEPSGLYFISSTCGKKLCVEKVMKL